MADSHHIIDGKVVPYSGGRKCNDTDAWRDATPLELQLQEQLEEYEHATAAKDAEIEALRAEVDMLRGKVDEAVVELLCRKARADRLAEALRDAGKSLRTIADRAGNTEYLMDIDDVRGYANSRANEAHAALAKENRND